MNQNTALIKKQNRDEIALQKYTMISPLLDENIDPAAARELRSKLAEQNGLSERTLRRYVNAYQKKGFEGLKPSERVRYKKEVMPDNYEEILQEAIQLRREVPRRSVEQIIFILESEGKVAPGSLKRPTLQRHLYQAGFGSTHMDIYQDARRSSSKRFCKPHRMMLIQGDIKYGPKLPIGKNGTMIQTYLSSAIDDHSRMILASQFYDNQEETIVEDTFHKVILKFGRFDKCYFDNGTQYAAKVKVEKMNDDEVIDIYREHVGFYYRNLNDPFEYAHITFMELDDEHQAITTEMRDIPSGVVMEGIASGVPSEMLGDSYRTGFGTKYANLNSSLMQISVNYNSLNAAMNGDTYRKGSCYTLKMGISKQNILERIYEASNWVTFINPKVDLNYFKSDPSAKDLLI